MLRDWGDPITEHREPCGCVWIEGKRVVVCSKHRHKDGIKPDKTFPTWK